MRIQNVGAVPSTAERQQRPLPFCVPGQTRPLDLEPKAAGGLVQTSGNVEGHQGAIGGFCTPYNSELMLACQVSARRPHYSTAAVPQLVPQ